MLLLLIQGLVLFSSDTLHLGEHTHSHDVNYPVYTDNYYIDMSQASHRRSPMYKYLMDTHSINNEIFVSTHYAKHCCICLLERHGPCYHCTKSLVGQIDIEQVTTNSGNVQEE